MRCASILTVLSVLALYKIMFSSATALEVFKNASAFSDSALNSIFSVFSLQKSDVSEWLLTLYKKSEKSVSLMSLLKERVTKANWADRSFTF